MTDTTPLTPAAQAVLYATHKAMAEQQTALSGVPDYRQVTAAALRAVADQVAPEFWHEEGDIYGETMQDVRRDLLAIADELEAQQTEQLVSPAYGFTAYPRRQHHFSSLLMTELSPAAKAVLDAFRAVPDLRDCPSIAAALRAAADQGEILFNEYDDPVQAIIVEDLLAIAKELEAQ